MPKDTDLVTASEAARILKLSARTVIRHITSGELPAVQKLPGDRGAWLLDIDDVTKFAERRRRDLLARLPEAPSRSRAEEVPA